MKIYDISPTLATSTPVWPGDTVFSVSPNWVLSNQCPVNVGKLTLSGHTGAHTDAPSHYGAAQDMADVALDAYLGPCRVFHCIGKRGTIVWEDISAQLTDNPAPCPERVLFRTYKHYPNKDWDETFCALDPSLILRLADLGVKLVGIDTASIDPMNSKTLDAHHAVESKSMAILEGVILDDVPKGDYELIALPLKLRGADASPVRAILRTYV